MRAVLTALLLTVLLLPQFLRADEPVKKADTKPPYQRLLQGDDARKAAELAKKIGQLRDADDCSAAIQVAEELLALRRRVQGADHYEAVNAHWDVEALRQLAALPVEQRSAWRAAARGNREAHQLEGKGRYAQALPLNTALSVTASFGVLAHLKGYEDHNPHTARSR